RTFALELFFDRSKPADPVIRRHVNPIKVVAGLSRLLYCALRCFSQPRECGWILHSKVGENFSIHIHARLLQTENELIVVQAVLTGGGADTNDPQAAEVALADFAVAISVGQRLFDRLLRKFVQLALVEVVALGKAEQLFPSIMPFGSAFDSRHGSSL